MTDVRQPTLLKGNRHQDGRGTLRYNNDFSLPGVQRFYTIQNADTQFIRAWQGHRVEQRWFSAMTGSFIIKLIRVDHWDNPSRDLKSVDFVLESDTLDILHVPPGYISSIQARGEDAVLLVFADYELGVSQDEYRFPADYFKN
ncbi:sugar epimerase [Chryseobacterium sp.]|nr:sugar epimerase [Chryseobacterium sp.]